jgi:hypothetical protein
MATLEDLADDLHKARQTGVETREALDRLKGGRLWTEFVAAAKAKGMTEEQAEQLLRDRRGTR